MPPIIIAGVIAAGAALGSAAISSSAAKGAAKTQAASARDATELQGVMYDQNRSDLGPYRQTGELALDRLTTLLGLGSGLSYDPYATQRNDLKTQIDKLKAEESSSTGRQAGLLGGAFSGISNVLRSKQIATLEAKLSSLPAAPSTNAEGFGSLMQPYSSFTPPNMIDDPGYQFRLSEGQKGVERSAAAKTGTLSGAATKDMARFTQDYASNEYGNTYNRGLNTWNANQSNYYTGQANQFNRLQTLAGMGENAAGQTANLGSTMANQVGQNIIGAGNATAAGQVGSANAWGSAISGIGSNIGNMLLLQNMMNQSGYKEPLQAGYSI
jgi:hypothetical protein